LFALDLCALIKSTVHILTC